MEIYKTDIFTQWFDSQDLKVRSRILARIDRLILGNLGDVKSVGKGVSEIRIDFGPGYRLYFTLRQQKIIILLVGGTKHRQQSDITKAISLAQNL